MPEILNRNFSNEIKTPSNHLIFDSASFEIFFKENFSTLCAYCQYKFHFDLDVAKEAVHTGFIKLWETRDSISNDLSVKAYLFTIITNTCYDILKHNKVKQRHEQHILHNATLSYSDNNFSPAELTQLSHDVSKAIAELPDQMRLIFEMSRDEGLKYKEIASKLSISVKTVETQMSRALARLRLQLSHYLFSLIFLILFGFFS